MNEETSSITTYFDRDQGRELIRAHHWCPLWGGSTRTFDIWDMASAQAWLRSKRRRRDGPGG